jgi:hypothetical protein
MKQIARNSIHAKSKSHDMILLDHNGKKVKITYEAYNAVERCNTEVFDGHQFNHVFSMMDLGIEPNNIAYIMHDLERKERADKLFAMAEKLCEKLLK